MVGSLVLRELVRRAAANSFSGFHLREMKIEELPCQQQQKDPLSPHQPKVDSSPATVLSPPLNLVRTVDNM